MKPKNLRFSPNGRIQLVIGFLDLFEGSLGQNSGEASARASMQNRKLKKEAIPYVAPLWLFSSIVTISLYFICLV